jgi:hypothetical protein
MLKFAILALVLLGAAPTIDKCTYNAPPRVVAVN